jgi:hypothetical protein
VTSHSPPQRHSSLPILSPVNFKDTPRPKAETHRSATPSPLSSPSYYTPGSSFSSMIKRVEKLSINYDICRRLFPDLSIPKKPSPTASRVVEGRGGPAYADVLIGRKHNKSRLRRLWEQIISSNCPLTPINPSIHSLLIICMHKQSLISFQKTKFFL